MLETRRDLAVRFALDHGFDGLVPDGCGCIPDGWTPPGVPEGCDFYEAGSCCYPGDYSKPLHPIYDSTLHIIVVDDAGARWRTDADAITLSREPIAP